MIRAFTLSLGQLGDPRILGVLAKVIGLGLLFFALLGVLIWWLADLALARAGWDGSAIAALAGAVLAILTGWLLWRAVAVAILNLFAEDVVDAVEARHYPAQRATAHPPGFRQSAGMALRSFGRALAINLLLLPVYAVLLFTGVGLAIAFFLVNGWLLGRDLSDMVAARHRVSRDDPHWGLTRGPRMLLGLAGMALLAMPIVNLIAPVVAAAMATHLVHREAGRRKELA